MPREFSFGEAAIVVICVVVGLIVGFGGLAYFVRFMATG